MSSLLWLLALLPRSLRASTCSSGAEFPSSSGEKTTCVCRELSSGAVQGFRALGGLGFRVALRVWALSRCRPDAKGLRV